MTARRTLSAVMVLLLAAACVSSCQKKEEAAAAPTAAPPPSPPAVSVAPLKEPDPPAPVAAASASAAEVTTPPSGAVTPVPSAGVTTEPKKVVPGGDLTACCTAIGAAAKNPGKNQNRYTTASAICTGLEKAVKSGKANFTSAKATLKLQLGGAPVPSGC